MKWKTKRYYKNQNELLKLEVSKLTTEVAKLKVLNGGLSKTLKKVETSLKSRSYELTNAKGTINRYLEETNRLQKQLDEKEKVRRKAAGSVGGLKRKNNDLEKELSAANEKIKDLEIKLEESMSDKYLVKKIKSGRKPKGQTIGYRSSTVNSNIMRNLHKEVDDEN